MHTFIDDLLQQFSEQGLSLESAEPVLSLIPTATEIGKAPLIAMAGNGIDLPADDYPGLVERTWTSSILKGKTATYLTSIGQLRDLRELVHDVYFLNFLGIDDCLHEDSQKTGQSHADKARDCLATLAKCLKEFAARFHIEARLTVYVLSDHGATRIAEGTVNVLDKAFYKGLALDKHHRYIALSDEKMRCLPQVAEAQCYVIDRQQFNTEKNYLAARGYFRFGKTTEGFHVHEGLTPEEVVVPFATFSFAPVEPLPPTLRLTKTQFRYSVKSPVLLEIGNPNPFPLESLVLELVDAEVEEAVIESLGPHQTTEVQMVTAFRKLPGDTGARQLTVRVRFHCNNRPFTADDITFDITVKSMMEVTDDGIEF